jgi:acylphosphatase
MLPRTISPDLKTTVPSMAAGWITASIRNSQHDEGLWQEVENNPTRHRGSSKAPVRWIIQGTLLCWLVASLPFCALAGEVAADSPTRKDEAGVLVHTVESEYQSRPTKIKVLLPDRLVKERRYPVLYVLPVEPLDGVQWGNGLLEVKKHDLHNRYSMICVMPTFSETPWYADHPTNAGIRQETYFVNVVVPFIDRTYPALAKRQGRLLLGFSKSGCGAFSLLLRHPELFGKAVAWDAPLMMERPDKYRMADIFGTQENFEQYRISTLLKKQAAKLSESVRLIHFGYGNFREHQQLAHRLMDDLKIAHQYRDGPRREHSWHSGWLPEAVQMLVEGPKGFQRREVHFSGHVQGVGFRQTTATLARQFAVTGFVKNLPDGRVQLIVEGQPQEIESFLAAIRKEMEKNINKTEEKTSPATGEFQGFEIRL